VTSPNKPLFHPNFTGMFFKQSPLKNCAKNLFACRTQVVMATKREKIEKSSF
jgi:hypothetical protein